MALTVEDLYRQILGREPDPGGLAYWQQQFGQEVDPTEKSVFQQVAAPEIASRQAPAQPSAPTSAPTPTAGTPRTISDVYRQFYGAVDPVGADFWRQQFGGENITPEQVARMVSDIGYNDPNANSGLTVEQVYRNYLGNTDQAGINYWKSQFGSGNLSNAQVAKLTEAQYGAVQRGGDGGFFGSVLGGLGSAISDIGGAIKGSGPIGAIAFTYFLPSLGAEIATKLGVDEIVGRAIAKATFNVAQGQDLDTAIKNSTIDAVTQTGSTDVAKDISKAVSVVSAEAIAGAGGSIAATLAKGGSVDDALKNATGSIVGAVTKGEFGQVAGSAAGGAVTGGLKGAVMGAGGQLLGDTKDTTKTAGADIPAAEYVQQAQNLLSQYQVAGALPLEVPTPSVSPSNAGPLIRLVQEAANDANYAVKLTEIEKTLNAAGSSIGRLLGVGVSLGLYSPELNANEDAILQQKFKEAGIDTSEYRKTQPTTDLGTIEITAPREIEVTAPRPSEQPYVYSPTEPVAQPSARAATAAAGAAPTGGATKAVSGLGAGVYGDTRGTTKTTGAGAVTGAVTGAKTGASDTGRVVTKDEEVAKEDVGLDVGTTPTTDTKTKDTVSPYIYSGFQKYPFLQPTGPKTPATPEVGSQALAQALRVGDPGEPLFGGKKKGPTSGWNIESLRYMGEES